MKNLLGKNVLLELIEYKKTDLVLIERTDERAPKMKVAMIGDDCKGIAVDEYVLVDPTQISPICYKINGKKYYRTNEYAIIGISDEDDEIDFLAATLEEKDKN